jgi:catalase
LRAPRTWNTPRTTTFGQPGTLYREVLSETDRDHLVTNIVNHLKGGAKPDMQQRAVEYWTKVDANLGGKSAPRSTAIATDVRPIAQRLRAIM